MNQVILYDSLGRIEWNWNSILFIFICQKKSYFFFSFEDKKLRQNNTRLPCIQHMVSKTYSFKIRSNGSFFHQSDFKSKYIQYFRTLFFHRLLNVDINFDCRSIYINSCGRCKTKLMTKIQTYDWVSFLIHSMEWAGPFSLKPIFRLT